jgi:glutamine synthetase
MNSADRIMLLKYLIKTVALKYNYHASFMPKPVFGEAGNGMHVHQSLISTKGENVFYDPRGEHELSDKAIYFLGGLLEHSRETCGILASWVNSYKRLVPGYEAPVYISWANRNRSALIRIPAGREMSTRLEVRNPDPAGNPYLQFAVMLASGLDGMDRKITPPEPVEKDIYKLSQDERHKLGIGTLPESLGEALHFLKDSKIVKETLGDHIFEHFLHIKRLEWDDYKAQVTSWERDRFLAHL